jgi:hypothetical protein
MPVLQLELNLWDQLAQAQQSPQDANWQQLCLAFDKAMDDTPVELKLAMAADAIGQMAEVLAARADEFFSTWRRVPEDGPVLDEDLFAEFVRQSFHLDLDGLVGVPELYVRSVSEKSHEDAESVVAEVTKETALLLAGAEPEPEDLIERLEHDEDVGAWATAIRRYLQQKRVSSAAIVLLEQSTGLSLVKLWLAGLLGGLEMAQSAGFYDEAGVVVSKSSG